jgi:glycosyltransferase involved in cell wall biosynthesis
MTWAVQYPVFGRRWRGMDPRAEWFTVWHEEIQRKIPTELINPANGEPWAETILRILDDPGFSSDLSRRGQEPATFFSAARSAEQVVSVYREVSPGVAGE